MKADNHKSSNDFLQTMLSNSLHPVITKPTRICKDSATLIDNIYCNSHAEYFDGIIYTDIFDHLPIFIIDNPKVR